MNLQQRTAALLELIDAHRTRRCAELRAPAEQMIRQIRREALAAARRRVHTAIEEERKRLAAQVGAAQARLSTARRQTGQARAAQRLALAWHELRQALIARWRNPATRRRWVEHHLERARMLAGEPVRAWMIRHAADWPADERNDAAARLALSNITCEFTADASMPAGLCVTAGHNTIDATLDGLLAERRMIEGRLLDLIGPSP